MHAAGWLRKENMVFQNFDICLEFVVSNFVCHVSVRFGGTGFFGSAVTFSLGGYVLNFARPLWLML